jgi:hypothetical protein
MVRDQERSYARANRSLRSAERRLFYCGVSALFRRFGRFVDGCHHFTGGGLLDHVAGAGNAVHFALPDLAVKPTRLLVDIDQAIVFSGNDNDRHGKFVVGF